MKHLQHGRTQSPKLNVAKIASRCFTYPLSCQPLVILYICVRFCHRFCGRFYQAAGSKKAPRHLHFGCRQQFWRTIGLLEVRISKPWPLTWSHRRSLQARLRGIHRVLTVFDRSAMPCTPCQGSLQLQQTPHSMRRKFANVLHYMQGNSLATKLVLHLN